MSPISGQQTSKGRRVYLSLFKSLALTVVVCVTLKPQWLTKTNLSSRITFEQGFDESADFAEFVDQNATLGRALQIETNSSPEILREHGNDSSRGTAARDIRTDDAGKWHKVLGEDVPVALEVADIDKIIEGSSGNSSNISFCIEWDFEAADDWWAHHVDWEVYYEDDTHYCFKIIENEDKRALFLKLYENQFHGNCSNMISQPMISSGWGASMTVVSNGLIEGLKNGQPVQTEIRPWIYAIGNRKDNVTAVCDSKDMYCFYLPTSSCPRREGNNGGLGYVRGPKLCCDGEYPWYLEFASRPQSWLRKRVYDFEKHQMASMSNFNTPCTVFHVRRGDVTMDKNKRGFRTIAEYLNATDKTEENVLLLTDDHNAIGEALHEFPDAKNWMYLNRTRHRGAEGGWQPFNPSGDLAHEMAVIMGTFRIAEQCSSIIRTNGGFASFLYGSTLKRHKDSWQVQLKNLDGDSVKSSVNVSKAYD